MSLQTRLSALITAIGTDIKSLNTQMAGKLGTTAKAADSELLDGIDSGFYLRKGMADGVGSRNTMAVATLNDYLISGWYDGSNVTGAPSTDWWLVEVIAHSNGAHWQRQIAYSFTKSSESATQAIYSRRCNGGNPTLSGSWSAWVRIDDQPSSVSTTTTIDGGATPGEAYTGLQAANGGSGIDSGLVDAKGDLIVASANDTPSRLGVGANGTVLTADSAEPAGVKWSSPPGRTELMVASDQAIQHGTAGTFVDITSLSWAAAANTTYEIEGIIWFTVAATTTGHRWGFVGPGLALANIVMEYQTSATAWATYDQQHNNTTMTGTPPMAVVTASALAGVPNIVRVKGIIRNGATAGTIKMQGASELNSASVTVLKGSSLTYKAL